MTRDEWETLRIHQFNAHHAIMSQLLDAGLFETSGAHCVTHLKRWTNDH